MAGSGEDLAPTTIEALIERLLERYRRGEAPDLSGLEAKYPQFGSELRTMLPALQLLAAVAAGTSSETRGGSGGVVTGSRLGEYRIIREVGRGGMGIVYEAEQAALGRRVALKVLPRSAFPDTRQVERLRREAMAAARLHHTNIVPVFGVGEGECDQGGSLNSVHYYAMQYIEGRSLDRVIDELRRSGGSSAGATSPCADELTGRLAEGLARGDLGAKTPQAARTGCSRGSREDQPKEPGGRQPSSHGSGQPSYHRASARIALQAAEALAHAHAQGVVHRDIKPSNLILDPEGVIWVSDFGLAQVAGTEALTQAGDLVGTLRYMAPERFKGESGASVDIYALGLTLHEILTLEPAFSCSDHGDLIHRITKEGPPRPRSRDSAIPLDLENIVLKSISRDPRQRYATAEELADDLGRFLRREPVSARPLGAPARAWRWCRRNPVVAALTVLAAGLLLAVASVSTAAFFQSERSGRALRDEKEKAVASLYRSLVDEVRGSRLARQSGYRERAWELVDQARRLETSGRSFEGLRQDAVECLGDFVGMMPRMVTGLPGQVSVMDVHPDSTLAAVGTREGGLHLYDLASALSMGLLARFAAGVTGLGFSARGGVLAAGDERGSVKVWNSQRGREWTSLKEVDAGGRVVDLALDAEGRTLLLGIRRLGLSLWDLESGSRTGILELPQGTAFRRGFARSQDGRLIATGFTGATEKGILVWDLAARRLIGRATTTFGNPYSAAFSPDGTRLAGGFDEGLEIFETSGWKRIVFVRSNWVQCMAFRPHSSILVYQTDDVLHFFRYTAGQELAKLRIADVGSVLPPRFALGGRLLLLAAERSLRTLNVAETPERLGFEAHEGGVPGLAFSPDGSLLATAGKDLKVRLWNTENGERVAEFSDFAAPPQTVDFSPDRSVLAAGDWAGRVVLLEVPSLRPLRISKTDLGDIWRIRFAPEGERLACGGDGGVRLWRFQAKDGPRSGPVSSSLEEIARPVRETVEDICWSPDGKLLAWIHRGRALQVLDVDSGSIVDFRNVRTHSFIRSLTFHKSGAIGFVTREGVFEVRDPRTGALAYSLGAPGEIAVTECAFNPDGTLLAVKPSGYTVALWDVRRRKRLCVLPADPVSHWCIDWSPDGTRLAMGMNDGAVGLWRLPELRAELRKADLDWGDD